MRLKGNSSLGGLGGGFGGPSVGRRPRPTASTTPATRRRGSTTTAEATATALDVGACGGFGSARQTPRGAAVAHPPRRVRRGPGPPGLRGHRRPLERLGDLAQRGRRARPARRSRARLPGGGRDELHASTAATPSCDSRSSIPTTTPGRKRTSTVTARSTRPRAPATGRTGATTRPPTRRSGTRKAAATSPTSRRSSSFLQFLNESDDETFAAELPERLDVDAFARYLAMMDLVANFDDIDGPGNNAYLWYDVATEQFTVVPWDMNLAFGALRRRAWRTGCRNAPEGFDPGQLPEGFDPTARGLRTARGFDRPAARGADRVSDPVAAAGWLRPLERAGGALPRKPGVRGALPSSSSPSCEPSCTAPMSPTRFWRRGSKR